MLFSSQPPQTEKSQHQKKERKKEKKRKEEEKTALTLVDREGEEGGEAATPFTAHKTPT